MNAKAQYLKAKKQYQSELDIELSNHFGTEYKEREIHSFIERNPEFLPNLSGEYCGRHHGAYFGIIISQFAMINGVKRIPDFAFLTKNSAGMCLNLIEIEAPNRLIFTSTNEFSQPFIHALETQIGDWRDHLSNADTKNVIKSQMTALINHSMLDGFSDFDVKYFLIYGRRSETQESPIRKRRWSSLVKKNQANGIEVMTWDRLMPSEFFESYIVAKYIESQIQWRAIEISRHADIDYSRCQNWKSINGITEAINNNSILDEMQKRKLIEEYTIFCKMTQKEYFDSLSSPFAKARK